MQIQSMTNGDITAVFETEGNPVGEPLDYTITTFDLLNGRIGARVPFSDWSTAVEAWDKMAVTMAPTMADEPATKSPDV